MSESVQVAAYENGALRFLMPNDGGEAVLALPFSRMLVKLVRVPQENFDDPVAFVRPLLQEMNPYPDEPLTVSLEKVRETERGAITIAAAVPESALESVAEQLDAAKLSVTRIDALAFGQIRGIMGDFGGEAVRRLVLIGDADGFSLIVLDGDSPVAVRALDAAGDLKREVMLSLLEAEDFGGAKPLGEIVWVKGKGEGEGEGRSGSTPDLQPLSALAPIRTVTIGEDAGLAGVAERTNDPGALNALPESWGGVLAETRFKAKLVRNIAIAGGIWALVMGVIFGVPAVFGLMTNHQKDLSKDHQRAYQDVKAMKEKVELVRKYSDHARGALEIMKAVSDRLPEGVDLDSWTYKREEGVRVSGLADEAAQVYAFKNKMDACGTETAEAAETSEGAEGGDAPEAEAEAAEGERVFGTVRLTGPSSGRGGRQRFELDCRYQAEEEDE